MQKKQLYHVVIMCLFVLLCYRTTNQPLQEGHLPTLTSERSRGTFFVRSVHPAGRAVTITVIQLPVIPHRNAHCALSPQLPYHCYHHHTHILVFMFPLYKQVDGYHQKKKRCQRYAECVHQTWNIFHAEGLCGEKMRVTRVTWLKLHSSVFYSAAPVQLHVVTER